MCEKGRGEDRETPKHFMLEYQKYTQVTPQEEAPEQEIAQNEWKECIGT